MKIQLVSDLHIDYNIGKNSLYYQFLEHADESCVLCIAGDLASLDQIDIITNFFDNVCPKYKQVLYVLGNHEYYYSKQEPKQYNYCFSDISEIKSYLESRYENLKLLDKNYYIEDNTVIIGCTLWTNFGGGNPTAVLNSKRMNDYKYIYDCNNSEYSLITPIDTYARFSKEYDWLLNTTSEFNACGHTTVWLTHHPYMINGIYEAIHPKYHNTDLVFAFASDPTYSEYEAMLLSDALPDIMMFGHTHYNIDKLLRYISERGLRYCSNCFGYGEELSGMFNPAKLIET